MTIVPEASHWPGDETERRSTASGHIAIPDSYGRRVGP